MQIHVEHHIQRIELYKILQHAMPISVLQADDIVTVCAAPINLMGQRVK